MTSPIICIECERVMPTPSPSGKCAHCVLPYSLVKDAHGNTVTVYGGLGRIEGPECSCTHDPVHHDTITGACHYTNVTHGPCPCAATPDEVRKAQLLAFKRQREVLKAQGR